jgi:hypothetical protein
MYRPVRPTQAVEVEHDGRWHAGELQTWLKDDDGSPSSYTA